MIAAGASQAQIYVGDTKAAKVYLGSTLIWEPPVLGVAYSDSLDSLSGFTQTNTGSGVVSNNGEAAWTGSSDGGSRVIYNQAALTDNQYVSAVLGPNITARSGVLIFHCNDAATGWYGVSWSSGSAIVLGRGSGNWTGSFDSTIQSVSTGSPGTDGTVELWNIGDNFKVAVNGTVVINTTVANSIRGSNYRRQGFGMYRSAFLSTGRIETWFGGDAAAYSKT
ncbi:hypothetical protein SEA_NEDARYA_8 [Gordonia phage Nedarya]|nr:hypothetical protein SEA_NEDARYA_8 [Gordonia phage Nedarya]